jgi:hypothetical protein
VAEQHGLAALQVGVAGGVPAEVGLGLVDEGRLQRPDEAGRAVAGVPGPQPQVAGDLVVAGPSGPELAAERAPSSSTSQRSIAPWTSSSVGRNGNASVGEQRACTGRGREQPLVLVVVEHADAVQLVGVGARAGEVLPPQVPVEGRRDPERPGGLVRAGEASAPQPAGGPRGRSGRVARGAARSQLVAEPVGPALSPARTLAAQVLSGRPHSFTKPSASVWSNWSPSS